MFGGHNTINSVIVDPGKSSGCRSKIFTILYHDRAPTTLKQSGHKKSSSTTDFANQRSR